MTAIAAICSDSAAGAADETTDCTAARTDGAASGHAGSGRHARGHQREHLVAGAQHLQDVQVLCGKHLGLRFHDRTKYTY